MRQTNASFVGWGKRCKALVLRGGMLAFLLMIAVPGAIGQTPHQYHRRLVVALAEPVVLDVALFQGELEIFYEREGEVSITVSARDVENLPEQFLQSALVLEQAGNRFTIRSGAQENPEIARRTVYRIDVPYRTEVRTSVEMGRQTISGVLGPVETTSKKGDIKVSYVSKSVRAQSEAGNLELDMIGEQVEARAGTGNIVCNRAAHGVTAETLDGDITLMVVGPSKATVKAGAGRINVGGVRGSLAAFTDRGDLHVKSTLHDDWDLRSDSGNIQVELPAAAQFLIDAETVSGQVLVSRDDLLSAEQGQGLHQQVRGGSKHLGLHTTGGNIVLR